MSWDAASREAGDDVGLAARDSPRLRFWLIFVVLLVPLSAVAARLNYVQRQLGECYVRNWESTNIREEPLPCRDGRILSADGRVLAQDRLRFDVLVHYRWLEEPADENWLKQRALGRLTRHERRVPEKLAAARAAVLEERSRLWTLLASTTGRTRDQLDRERSEIQRRVERVVASVTERRDARLPPPQAASGASAALERLTSLEGTSYDLVQLKDAMLQELTATPRRSDSEPLIVQEQLAHHPVVEDIDLQVVARIESAPSLFPGVRIRASSERIYPGRDTAAHLVGVRTAAAPGEIAADADAQADQTPTIPDRIGRTGIERAFDQTLRGNCGRLRIVTDRRGEILSQSILEPPVHGRDVVLTIDARLQRAAEELLDDAIRTRPTGESASAVPAPLAGGPNGGCLIAIDVRTGDVITAAAAPRFDLGLLLHPAPDEWQRAISDTRQPFFPRVTRMTIPPGSVFKILTAIALLESRLIDPNAPVFCRGYLDRPDRNRCYVYRHYGIGHGDMTLSDALCQSCNVYFFHAARTLGPQPIADWAARFGLGRPTGGEIPGEQAGHVPKTGADGTIVDEDWYSGSTLQLAIGQASLTVTPLQIARMVAAVANDGYLVTPRFVRDEPQDAPLACDSIELAGGAPATIDAPTVQRIPGLTPGTLARIREGMRMVVENRQGTGKRVRLDELAIAGKTGTAEVGGGKADHAWFVGFAPVEAPRYAFVVVIEHGGSGGSVAAPIAKHFIETMLEAGVLPRSRPAADDRSATSVEP